MSEPKRKLTRKQIRSRIHGLSFIILSVLVIMVAPFFILFLSVGNFEWDFKAQVNATIVNGILTGDAIVFGLVSFGLREIGKNPYEKFFLYLVPLWFLSWTVQSYFVDTITLGYPTVNTMIIATGTFFLNIFYYAFILYIEKNPPTT